LPPGGAADRVDRDALVDPGHLPDAVASGGAGTRRPVPPMRCRTCGGRATFGRKTYRNPPGQVDIHDPERRLPY
jgi:hypothetical protein